VKAIALVEREGQDGSTRYLACYRDPEGRIRSATHSTRRTAERAANREDAEGAGRVLARRQLRAVTFRDYVETDWLPSKHIEPTTGPPTSPT
jgi:hypothetical protein